VVRRVKKEKGMHNLHGRASSHVRQEKQYWNCFGASRGAKGDQRKKIEIIREKGETVLRGREFA